MCNKSVMFPIVSMFFFAFPMVVIAAPYVSGVAGTVTGGSKLTIDGNDFGSKETAAPLRYDFFEQAGDDFAQGQPVTNSGWSTVYAPQFITPIFENEAPKPGSAKFARALHQSPGSGMSYNDSMFYYDGGSTELSPVYVTFYYRRTHVSGPETDNNKWLRIAQDASDGTGDAPCVAHTFLNESKGSGSNISGFKGEPNKSLKVYWHSVPPYGEWIRWEGYYVKGAGSNPNGTIVENAWFGEGKKFHTVVSADGSAVTDTSGSTSRWHDVIFGGYCRLGSLSDGVDSSVVYYSDFDDVYIDKTQARVEIGDNATWADCTRREIQVPTEWSTNSISITVNSGSFAEGQSAYLFVVDADGNVSNGRLVEFASGGGATPPPADERAPTVANVVPAGGAINVPVNDNVVAHVQDAGDGVDSDTLGMTVNGTPVAAVISGTSSDYTLTYDPPQNFAYNSEVQVMISASDLAGNAMTPATYSFTTAAAPDTISPVVQITSPVSASSYATEIGMVTLGGSADDNVSLASLTWSSSSGASGSVAGSTTWSIEDLLLKEGDNIITVTVTDGAGNQADDVITVTYTPPAGQTTVTFGDAAGAEYPGTVTDTFLNLNTDVNGAVSTLNAYTWPTNSVANAPVLKWNLSPIPAGATIERAELQLYLLESGGDATYTMSAHRIINHDPDLSASNGNTYDGSNQWTANTLCYDGIPLAQADIAVADSQTDIDQSSGYKTLDVTDMVRGWVSGGAHNFGMLINSDAVASANSFRTFAASEHDNASYRPRLVITYHNGVVVDAEAPGAPLGVLLNVQ